MCGKLVLKCESEYALKIKSIGVVIVGKVLHVNPTSSTTNLIIFQYRKSSPSLTSFISYAITKGSLGSLGTELFVSHVLFSSFSVIFVDERFSFLRSLLIFCCKAGFVTLESALTESRTSFLICLVFTSRFKFFLKSLLVSS